MKYERALGLIYDWACQYSEALKPTAGSADSFGDGMRAAKSQIQAIMSSEVINMHDERRQLAINELVESAEKWSRAHTAWEDYDGDDRGAEDEMQALARHLRKRLELAAMDLVRFGGTR
jgi:hypothetical protein